MVVTAKVLGFLQLLCELKRLVRGPLAHAAPPTVTISMSLHDPVVARWLFVTWKGERPTVIPSYRWV